MTVAETTEQSGPISLGEAHLEVSRSPWMDAWRRLRRNKAAIVGAVIIFINFMAAYVLAPVITNYTYEEQNYLAIHTAPQWVIDVFPKMKETGTEGGYVAVNNDYVLGTDALGRDLWTRIIYGARISLAVALVGPLTSLIIGTIYGMAAGYLGGQVDTIMMRIVDIMYAFPTLLLIILMMAFFRASRDQTDSALVHRLNDIDSMFGGMLFIFIGIGITSWMNTARLARGQVLSIRRQEYIEAAHSIGANNSAIIFRHILPNIMGPIIVRESLSIPLYISLEAFLSFIGLGVNPPTPSWGSMISDGAQSVKSYPNEAIFPAAALFLIMFAFNFLGDGLRDALDPRATKES
jgi:oligopeptide transport system permease protein